MLQVSNGMLQGSIRESSRHHKGDSVCLSVGTGLAGAVEVGAVQSRARGYGPAHAAATAAAVGRRCSPGAGGRVVFW